ncbi:MAG: beta strand repeat-containing protein, partial [Gaiellaceae bacterium]
TASFDNKNVGTAKTVTASGFTKGGTDAGNYVFANPQGTTTADITAKTLTVSASGINKVYDGNAVATVTLSDNRVSGDVFTDSYTSATFNNTNVGTGKPVSVSGISISGTDAGNYSFNTTVSTSADITARKLTVTAATNTKTYDGTTSAAATPTITSGALQGSDTANLLETYDTMNVGTGKTLTPSGSVSDGNGGNNYAVTFVSNTTGVINARAITIKANNLTKVYGDSFTSAGTEFTVSAGSYAPGDSASVTLASTGFAAGALVGSYTITPSAAVFISGPPTNYAITYQTGTLTVTPRQAQVAYIGQTTFWTSGSSTTTTNATLTASVQEDGTSGGSVANSTVTFTDMISGKVLASGVKVSPVSNTATQLGTANTTVSLSSGNYGANGYLVKVTLNGSLVNTQQLNADPSSDAYKAAYVNVSVLVPPTANTYRGAAAIPKLATAAGSYGDSGDVSYSGGISYNSSGTNPQGQIQLIVPRADGIYYVKTNSITSVTFPTKKDAIIYAKASIFKLTGTSTLASVDGNVTFRIDAHDGCSTTSCTTTLSGDKIGFTVLSTKNSSLYYSNNWVYDSGALAWKTVTEAIDTPDSAVQIN